MREIRKLLAGALCLALALAGCGKSDWVYRPLTDVEDLEGRRVGVNLAWEADYLLTGRKDMELFRYDDSGAMIMALSANKLDVVAMDELYWKMAQAVSEGLAKVEPSFTTAEYVCYVAKGREDLLDEFNAFLHQEYLGSPDCERIRETRAAFDGENYQLADTPLTGTGETLRVAALINCYPRSFCRAGESLPVGFDVEPVKLFANARNYRVEFTGTVYEDMLMGMQNGMYDLAVGFLSECYRKDVEKTGVLMTDVFDTGELYFVERTREKIVLHGDVA